MKKNVTIKELMELLNKDIPDASNHLDYITVSSLIKVLILTGHAKENGNRPNPAGTRGKPATVYEVENNIEFFLFENEGEDSVNTDLEIPGRNIEAENNIQELATANS